MLGETALQQESGIYLGPGVYWNF